MASGAFSRFAATDEKAMRRSSIREVLADIDMLIDGAYVDALADGAETWTGSGNQRVIDMRETRRAGQIVLYSVALTCRKRFTPSPTKLYHLELRR